MKTLFINTLSDTVISEIKQRLLNVGLSENEVVTALNSRLFDLENTIEINDIIERMNK